MRECDYYAPGTYNDPHAPWNQCDQEPIEREVVAEFALSKSTPTSTTNYYLEGDKYEGYHEVLDGVDWSEEYHKQHYTPLELINKFKEYLTDWLPKTEDKSKQWQMKQLIEECDGWDEDLTEINEE